MSAFLATLAATIPNVFLAIFAKLFTEKFMQAIIEKVLIFGLKKAASMTTNTIDDDLVLDVENRLKGSE